MTSSRGLACVPAVLCGALLLSGCGVLGGDDTTGTKISIAGDDALTWGNGSYGVVLAHGASYDAASWEDQATALADAGTTVVAVEDIGTDAIAAAVGYLKAEGIADVALVGGSKGADAILDLVVAQPTLPDQLVLLSPNHTVEGLGDEPALFIASRDEPLADVSTRLAADNPGPHTEATLLPGKTHAQGIFDTSRGDAVLETIVDRITTYGVDQ